MKQSLLLAALFLAACGQKAADAPAEASAAATQQAQDAAVAAGVPVEAVTATAPTGVNGTPVDTCAMLDAEDALAVVGELYKPAEARPATGSLLGQCEYFGKKLVLLVSAHPAAEYKGTVDYAAKKGGGSRPVANLGSAADLTSFGLMIQPAGKPYFIVVYAMSGGKANDDTALAIGRKLKL